MRLIVTGGGTGGHVYPAIAIANDLRSTLSADVEFIGSNSGPESAAARDAGLIFMGLDISGIVGKRPLEALRSSYRFIVATVQCRRSFGKERPDCVIGTGGFAAAPACFAALLAGIPLVIHEMNFKPGLVTRLLCKRAAAVAVAYEGTVGLLKKGTRAMVTGVPVRGDIERLSDRVERKRARIEALQLFGLEADRGTLLVFGGSQGALALNEAIWEALGGIADRDDIQVLHLTGRTGYEDTRRESMEASLETKPLLYRAFAYCEKMHLAYSVCDLALTRAGAGTLAELTAARVPSILVPYPYSSSGHQERNAEELANLGGAVVVKQDGESASEAASEALKLLADPNRLEEMRNALLEMRRRPGSEGIAGLVEELT